jgi:hypothetical protein
VCPTCHRILGNVLGRREVAAREVVGSVSGRGDDHALAVDLRDRVHVGAQGAYDVGVLEDCEVVEAVEVNLDRSTPERFGETGGQGDRF